MTGIGVLLFCPYVHSCLALVVGQNHGQQAAQIRVATVDEFLSIGNKLGGRSEQQIRRAKRSTKIDWFKNTCGSTPRVVAKTWNDLHGPTESSSTTRLTFLKQRRCRQALIF